VPDEAGDIERVETAVDGHLGLWFMVDG
jgi:hypothetical protein